MAAGRAAGLAARALSGLARPEWIQHYGKPGLTRPKTCAAICAQSHALVAGGPAPRQARRRSSGLDLVETLTEDGA